MRKNNREETGIREISLENLRIHPKNIRKEYNDIDELTASIREKGILQNLTVVPDPEVSDGYLVVIGNRRLTAARNAGLKTAPCRIVEDMPESEQVMAMLTENMQRSNLTVSEEAAGIQMCLSDFGFTIEDIAQKTGLSQTTVRHRANIAKLNQQVLRSKEADEGFQLNLTDLTRLEKVSNIATRNKILKEARDSKELAWKAQSAAEEEKRAKVTKKLVAMAKKEGIAPAPEGTDREMYSGKWNTVKEYSLTEDAPELLYNGDDKDSILYIIQYRSFKLIRKAPKEKKILTKYQIKEREVNKKKRQMKAMFNEILTQFRDFILSIIYGKIDELKDTKDLISGLWDTIVAGSGYVSMNSILSFLLGSEVYGTPTEELEKARDTAFRMPVHQQMLAVAYMAVGKAELCDYKGYYAEAAAKKIIGFFDCLALYGFTFTEENGEYTALLTGSHELYSREADDTAPVDPDNDANEEVPAEADKESDVASEPGDADIAVYDWYEDDVYVPAPVFEEIPPNESGAAEMDPLEQEAVSEVTELNNAA